MTLCKFKRWISSPLALMVICCLSSPLLVSPPLIQRPNPWTAWTNAMTAMFGPKSRPPISPITWALFVASLLMLARIASPTSRLELTMRPTAPTPSRSLALFLLREPQDLMLHLYLPSLRIFFCQCSRFHPLLLAWIFAESLLFKNPKLTRNSGILLTFLTILPRHVGPYMLSRRRNALPKSSSTPRELMPRHTLEFRTITNLQHLRSKSFFWP